jgi:hypothetical protein
MFKHLNRQYSIKTTSTPNVSGNEPIRGELIIFYVASNHSQVTQSLVLSLSVDVHFLRMTIRQTRNLWLGKFLTWAHSSKAAIYLRQEQTQRSPSTSQIQYLHPIDQPRLLNIRLQHLHLCLFQTLLPSRIQTTRILQPRSQTLCKEITCNLIMLFIGFVRG